MAKGNCANSATEEANSATNGETLCGKLNYTRGETVVRGIKLYAQRKMRTRARVIGEALCGNYLSSERGGCGRSTANRCAESR